MPDSNPGRDPIDRMAESVVGRLRAGRTPDPLDYAARYPDLASQVNELLPALVELEQNASIGGREDRAPRGWVDAADAPRQLGEYTIVREIGRGGMGVVYEAVQESLGRHVALKVFHFAGWNAAHLERFRREARAAARLHHTHIVPVYGVGEAGGVHFYAMQFIRGQSVNLVVDELRRLRGTPRRPGPAPRDGACFATPGGEWSTSASGTEFYRAVARLGLQVAEALDYAHSHGVLHRDVKPSNLLLDGHGTVWVTDFGLAKSEGTHDLTETGDVVGTLHYMPPERMDGRSDARTDVYGLGAALYELVALRPPYRSPSRAKLIEQILYAPPPSLRKHDPDIPRDLETVVGKALAKDPAERYASARQMADDLRLFLSDRSIRSRRPTAFERLWRWRRRNPALAAITAALVVVFALGFAGVTWKWRDAERARRSEQAARNDADRRAAEIQEAQVRVQEATRLVDIGAMFSDSRGWDNADVAYSKAVALRPELAVAWEKRGELYFRLGLFDLAAADFQRAFELNEPISHRQWLRLALLRLYVGDAAGYQRVARRMAERFRGTVIAPVALDVVRACSLSDHATGDAAQRVTLAQMLSARSPPEDGYPYAAAAACYRAGEYGHAIRYCESAPSGSTTDALCLPVLAMSHHRLGQADSARRAFDEAAQAREWWLERIHSSHVGSWIVDQGATGQWPVGPEEWLEFELLFRQAAALLGTTLPDEEPRLIIQRARALAGLRRREAADAEYAAALRLRPQDPRLSQEAHRNRGFLRLRTGRFEDAAHEFERAMGPDRSDYDLWRYVAISQYASGDVEAYRQTCAQMLDRFGMQSDGRALLTIVLTYTVCPGALPDMTRALEAGQGAARWWVDSERVLVGLYYRLGRNEDALEALRRHSRFAVAHPTALFFAAMASHRLGRPDEARRLYDEATAAMAPRTDVPALRTLVTGSDPRDAFEKLSEQMLRKEAESLILGPGR